MTFTPAVHFIVLEHYDLCFISKIVPEDLTPMFSMIKVHEMPTHETGFEPTSKHLLISLIIHI